MWAGCPPAGSVALAPWRDARRSTAMAPPRGPPSLSRTPCPRPPQVVCAWHEPCIVVKEAKRGQHPNASARAPAPRAHHLEGRHADALRPPQRAGDRQGRHLVPYLAEADARMDARYAWQACAALYAWYSTEPPPSTEGHTPPSEDPDTLIDRAVAAGGAHTIKLTEACLREYALQPKAVSLVAARDVVARVGGAF